VRESCEFMEGVRGCARVVARVGLGGGGDQGGVCPDERLDGVGGKRGAQCSQACTEFITRTIAPPQATSTPVVVFLRPTIDSPASSVYDGRNLRCFG
jgi:hypothetical protein